jgi:hypothetical protein
MNAPVLTKIYDEFGEPLCAFTYNSDNKHLHGIQLADFLDGYAIGEGLSRWADTKVAENMPHLAAQIVDHFQASGGNVYMAPPTTQHDAHAYEVRQIGTDLTISIVAETIGVPMTPSEFKMFAQGHEV